MSVSGSATVSDLTGCPATVELTVSAADSCGNNAAVCTAEIDVQDVIAPVIAAVADDVVVDTGCTASVPFSATITDNCCVSPGSLDLVVTVQNAANVTAGTPVVSSVTPISANEIEIEGTVDVSNVTACPASVTLAFNAKDCCGNSAVEVTDDADVADNAAPVVTCANVTFPSDAGFCTASVLLTASALDNCAGATAVSYYANLDANPDYETLISNPYVFSQGITEVQARSTDNCSNTGTCDFTVTVQDINKAKVTVVLEGVTIPTTRCISFVPLLSGGPCVQNALVNELSFVDHDSNPATPVRAVDVLVDIPCGDYESLCAKDEQHTLSDSHVILINGAIYEAVADHVLLGGDTDDDDDIDINDVTLLLAQFGTLSSSGGCPWDGTRDSDFSNNGARSTEDYVFLSDNWLEFRNCCAGNGWPLVAPPPSAQPVVPAVTLDGQPIRTRRYSIGVVELSPTLVPADLTGDGVVDFKDVKRFETINGLPHVLSTRIQIDEQQAKSAEGKARTSP
ncbi:MAG: hypothetical protein IPK83_01670 [Planctomycetes bacterium]|nr:hypothetical protein [Planctomycetota bacterium]